MWINKYGKALAAALLALLTAAHTYLADEIVTEQEWVQIAIAGFTALSVWLVPALDYPRMKTVIAVVLASLNVLATVIIDGIDQGDLVQVVMAGLTVLAVGAAPAHSDVVPGNDPPPPAI